MIDPIATCRHNPLPGRTCVCGRVRRHVDGTLLAIRDEFPAPTGPPHDLPRPAAVKVEWHTYYLGRRPTKP